MWCGTTENAPADAGGHLTSSQGFAAVGSSGEESMAVAFGQVTLDPAKELNGPRRHASASPVRPCVAELEG